MSSDRDIQITTYHALQYVSLMMHPISERVAEGMSQRKLARNLLSNMRTSLSVPAIFAAMRILRRLKEMFTDAAEAFSSGDILFDDVFSKRKARSSVEYTVRKIFKDYVKQHSLTSLALLEASMAGYNPYQDMGKALDGIIYYTSMKQFGVNLNEYTSD